MTDPATTESGLDRSEPKLNRKPRGSRLREATVWQPIQDGWRQVYGGFYNLGVSIEWHDFELSKPFEWSRSFHPDSLEICLNLAGHGSIHWAQGTVDFEPLTAGFYLPGDDKLRAWRKPGDRHRFITIEFSPRFLRAQLAMCDGALHPLVEAVVRDEPSRTGASALVSGQGAANHGGLFIRATWRGRIVLRSPKTACTRAGGTGRGPLAKASC